MTPPQAVEKRFELHWQACFQLLESTFETSVGALDQQGDVATFRPLESQPTDKVRFTGSRFTLYDTEGMFARCIRQRLENCAFVSGPNLALMAAPNVESLDGTMGGEENRLVMLQSFVRDNARHFLCTPARLHGNIHILTSPRIVRA
ncbi:hypothetical protein [Agrobacterium cavarae]|uniref:hypothetical protein n=1 Tax=Agrobacterium cavarae TaxID=2528239 RepID=UPI003FD65A7C